MGILRSDQPFKSYYYINSKTITFVQTGLTLYAKNFSASSKTLNTTKLYARNSSGRDNDGEAHYRFTFSEPFILDSFDFSMSINDSRTPTVYVYGCNDNSFSDDVLLGSVKVTASGTHSVVYSGNQGFKYYDVWFLRNWYSNGGYSVWSMDGSTLGSNSYRFLGHTKVLKK